MKQRTTEECQKDKVRITRHSGKDSTSRSYFPFSGMTFVSLWSMTFVRSCISHISVYSTKDLLYFLSTTVRNTRIFVVFYCIILFFPWPLFLQSSDHPLNRAKYNKMQPSPTATPNLTTSRLTNTYLDMGDVAVAALVCFPVP